jgi:hypothetical protein
MRRRDFITLVGGGVAAWPLGARAQQPGRLGRIGSLMNFAANDPEGQARFAAFLEGLQQLGWTNGRNLQIDNRWVGSDSEYIRKQAIELVGLTLEVILASASITLVPLQQATRTIPIVFASVIDPVGTGLVASMARPGSNATGFVAFEYSMSAKWLELLKETAPSVTRAAVLWEPGLAVGIGQLNALQAAAPSINMELTPVDVRDTGELERALAEFARSPAEIEKPPPTSAIPRSTSCEDMVEPSVASAMTPIVSIATCSGGRAGAETAGLRCDACTDCGAEISRAIACTGVFGTRPLTNCRSRDQTVIAADCPHSVDRRHGSRQTESRPQSPDARRPSSPVAHACRRSILASHAPAGSRLR